MSKVSAVHSDAGMWKKCFGDINITKKVCAFVFEGKLLSRYAHIPQDMALPVSS